MNISIVLSTYNQPLWLKKVLIGYDCQNVKDFEVVIADDGSDENTRAVIQEFSAISTYPIKHVWHEDKGFRKTEILNKAMQQCATNYFLFSDGDCIPRADFVARHLQYREKGYFLSGGYFKLPKEISEAITEDDIRNQNCFDIQWLRSKGLPFKFKFNKLSKHNFKAKLKDWITPTKATWNGMNSSGWKEDIFAANGFDERMQYGGEDRELGERLMNKGIKPKQIRFRAVCVHLHHERGYVKPEMIENNKKIRKVTKEQKLTRTLFGIEKI
ncbi:glycosyltransferase family 2 protein [Aquimarina brevivitae]|uniref:Galactosyltransferase-like protein n=1 Tax=Aquimarina brevivitae TaxID=323412 RepID=A0A4Q7PJW2_9FLAO|nr:glycosyltransferase family 2 protein [Aquimarina brevivitae]RZT00349.1 galactosyltransferase-like protein [Aquimarina brevivitae]